MSKTRVKICGLKRLQDIEYVNELRPDYVGFVFASFSKRYIDRDTAQALKRRLSPEIKAVGVFVDEDLQLVESLLSDGVIDIVQLHGHEDETYIQELRKRTEKEIIKVFNMNKTEDTGQIESSSADFVMLDSGYGTGETFDWAKIKQVKRAYFLAGGLSPENVEEAVRELAPFAVDVSSGVESGGVKSRELIRRFIETVKEVK